MEKTLQNPNSNYDVYYSKDCGIEKYYREKRMKRYKKEDVSVLTHPLCYPLLYHTVLPASWAAARHTTATETTATDCGHDAARREPPDHVPPPYHPFHESV